MLLFFKNICFSVLKIGFPKLEKFNIIELRILFNLIIPIVDKNCLASALSFSDTEFSVEVNVLMSGNYMTYLQ